MNKDAGGAKRPAGLVEYLFAELRHAFQDVRQKALEEGWFGRVVTAAPVVEMDRQGQDRDAFYGDTHSLAPEKAPSFEELWKPRERSQDNALEQPSQPDIGIDR